LREAGAQIAVAVEHFYGFGLEPVGEKNNKNGGQDGGGGQQQPSSFVCSFCGGHDSFL